MTWIISCTKQGSVPLERSPWMCGFKPQACCPAVILVWTVSRRDALRTTHLKVMVAGEISGKSFQIPFYLKKSFFLRPTISLQCSTINRSRVIVRDSGMCELSPSPLEFYLVCLYNPLAKTPSFYIWSNLIKDHSSCSIPSPPCSLSERMTTYTVEHAPNYCPIPRTPLSTSFSFCPPRSCSHTSWSWISWAFLELLSTTGTPRIGKTFQTAPIGKPPAPTYNDLLKLFREGKVEERGRNDCRCQKIAIENKEMSWVTCSKKKSMRKTATFLYEAEKGASLPESCCPWALGQACALWR